MKNLITGALLGAALSLASMPAAAKFEMSEVTCKQMVDISKQDPASFAVLMVWIDGYLGGVVENTEFDPEYMTTLTEAFLEVCMKSPKKNVIEAAREVAL